MRLELPHRYRRAVGDDLAVQLDTELCAGMQPFFDLPLKQFLNRAERQISHWVVLLTR
ncbi:MAG: hypothetical protein IH867_10150 [Chloroflexi bacterium]|nr:hypothetical protein [Chloroflexota bacterium]